MQFPNVLVGARGFEPPTSCSQGRRANQAALRPDDCLLTDACLHGKLGRCLSCPFVFVNIFRLA